jgi:4-amino-4-deoxy-L-arabinose transferase-like glycosyltransferase
VWSLRVAVGALLLFLTVPRMAQRGMFGDGLLYATIARNLSIGVGSLWAPTYTDTIWPAFFEHPPLGFALEAVAFRLFGDHLAVERLYSLAVFGVHALIIMAIWRRLQPAAYDWLPLLFWILPSIVTWAVVNNMLENTQAMLTSAAVLLLVSIPCYSTSSTIVIRAAAAALIVVAAVLTKGPVGFFPLAVPIVSLLFPHVRGTTSSRLVITVLLVMLIVIGICSVGLMTYEPSRRAIAMYVDTQVTPSLRGVRETTRDAHPFVRHVIVGIFARMTALLVLLSLITRAIERRRSSTGIQTALWSMTIGLCASVPILVSPKISGHYFLPSVPLFALAFASFASAFAIPTWIASHRRVPSVFAAVLFAATLVIPIVHGPVERRDADMLRNLDAIAAAMPRDTIIGTCREDQSPREWSLHTYVQRLYRVSLDMRGTPVNGWLLQVDHTCAPPPSCTLAARGERFTLFRCGT